MPIAAVTAAKSVGFRSAHAANFSTTGNSFSKIGRNAAPMDSFVSPKAMPNFFIPPAAVLAAASPAPPKLVFSTPMTSVRSAPSSIISLSSGDRV